MLPEYRDIITHMKQNNAAYAHFMKVFEKHNSLDDQIAKVENGGILLSDLELEVLKKEKLLLKDEVYALVIRYKKEHNL